MARKSRLKKHKKKAYFKKRLIAACIILLLFLIPLVFFMSKTSKDVHQHDAREKKLEMTKLPASFQKALPAASSSASFRIPILLYHYVERVVDMRDTIRQSLNILPSTFDRQLVTLLNNGYTFMTMEELALVLDEKMKMPPKPIILTFDDGYRDFYTDVFPILRKYNVKAVAYLVPGFFDKPNYLLTRQVKEIANNPLVEIGAHTLHHAYLKKLDKKTTSYEISQSKIDLEKLIGRPVVSFAYPYGAFDEQAISLTKEAQFKTAVSTIPGITVTPENRYFIFRIRPGSRSGEELLQYLKQATFKAY